MPHRKQGHLINSWSASSQHSLRHNQESGILWFRAQTGTHTGSRRLRRSQSSNPAMYHVPVATPVHLEGLGGGAAWWVCREPSVDAQNHPALGEKAVRIFNYEMALTEGRIPLNVTFLPVDQNMRLPERAERIRKGLPRFLSRNDWKR